MNIEQKLSPIREKLEKDINIVANGEGHQCGLNIHKDGTYTLVWNYSGSNQDRGWKSRYTKVKHIHMTLFKAGFQGAIRVNGKYPTGNW